MSSQPQPQPVPMRRSNRILHKQSQSRSIMLQHLTCATRPFLDEDSPENVVLDEEGNFCSGIFPGPQEQSGYLQSVYSESEKAGLEADFLKSPADPSIVQSQPIAGLESLSLSGSAVAASAAAESARFGLDAAIKPVHMLESDKPPPSIAASLQSASSHASFDLLNLSTAEIAALFKSLSDAYFPRKRLHLPKRQKTLVLDLDETLIHSTSKSSKHYDTMIEVLMSRSSCLYYVFKRPHVDYFLKKVSQWYDLVIFTASLPEYADPVIDWLDAGARILQKRFFRQSCIHKDGMYLKELTLIEPDLSRVVLVDNSPMSYILNPENAVPIISWINDKKDEALLDLLPFLDALRFTEDVRSILSLRKTIA